MDKNTSPSPTSHFLKEVTEQISYKPLRPSIRQELESHIQDRMEDYESQGLSPKEAEAQALRCMGDAAAIGTRLNEVHKLQKGPAAHSGHRPAAAHRTCICHIHAMAAGPDRKPLYLLYHGRCTADIGCLYMDILF